MTETRPAGCRFRLRDERKPYPRSGCTACGKTVLTGLGTHCTVPPMIPVSKWTPWAGDFVAPSDWDGGAVLHRDGFSVVPRADGTWTDEMGRDHMLTWIHNGSGFDIVGYHTRPTAPIDHVAALLAEGWTHRDDGTLAPPDPLVDMREMLAQFADSIGLAGVERDLRQGVYDAAVQKFQDALALKRPIE